MILLLFKANKACFDLKSTWQHVVLRVSNLVEHLLRDSLCVDESTGAGRLRHEELPVGADLDDGEAKVFIAGGKKNKVKKKVQVNSIRLKPPL